MEHIEDLEEQPSIFQEVARELGDIVTNKNKKYGDSFGKTRAFLEILWPNGIPVEAFNDALAIVRVFDKLMRIATNNDPKGEDAWSDLCGYGILAVAYNKQREEIIDQDDIDQYCGFCANLLTIVRPGKWQCDYCDEEHYGASTTAVDDQNKAGSEYMIIKPKCHQCNNHDTPDIDYDQCDNAVRGEPCSSFNSYLGEETVCATCDHLFSCHED